MSETSSTRGIKRAFFDLDYTLLPHDTLFLFAAFIIRRKPWRIYYLFFFGPALCLYVIGLLGALGLKRSFFTIIRGLDQNEVRKLSNDFAAALGPLIYPEIRNEIESLKAEGATLYLNSASPQFYIETIAEELGFDHSIGTPFELPEKLPLFIKASGPNNKHAIKLDHMRGIVDELHDYDSKQANPIPCLSDSKAYSDSSADLPLLELASQKVVIHPSSKLRQIAEKSGWTIWQPTRPYSSRLGQALMIVRQMFGLYRI